MAQHAPQIPGPRRALVVTALVVLTAVALRIQNVYEPGVTVPEAGALALARPLRMPAWPEVAAMVSQPAPLAALYMDALGASAASPGNTRLAAVGLGAWCLLLLIGIARRSSWRSAPLWTAALAGTAVVWLAPAQQLHPTIVCLWGVLLALWGFGMYWRAPGIGRWCGYTGCALLSAAATPAALALLAAQGVCLVVAWSVGAARSGWRTRLLPAVAGLGTAALVPAVCVLTGVLVPAKGLSAISSARPFALQNLPDFAVRLVGTLIKGAPVAALSPADPLLLYATLGALMLAVLAVIDSSSKGRGEERIWGACVLLMAPLWLGVRDVFGCENWPLLPLVTLLVANGVAWATGTAAAYCALLRTAWIRRAATGFAVLLLAAGMFVWTFQQYQALLVWRSAQSETDLQAPITFLQDALRPGDRLVVVSGTRQQTYERRLYLAPFLAALPRTRVDQRTPTEWRTRAQWISLPSNGVLWAYGMPLSDPGAESNQLPWLHQATLPFVRAVACIAPTGAWTDLDELRLLEQASARWPQNAQIAAALLTWYRMATNTALEATLLNGAAGGDIARTRWCRALDAYRRRAANRVLYAWDERGDASATNYPRFLAFVSATWDAPLDGERTLYLFRRYAEDSLAHNDIAQATKIMLAGRHFDRRDPYMDRTEAQILSLRGRANAGRAEALNRRAMTEHLKRYGRPFVDAWLAVILSYQERGKFDQSLTECEKLLHYLKREFRIPYEVMTNMTPRGRQLRQWWRDQARLWESQANTLMALLHAGKSDYDRAIACEQRNLSPYFTTGQRNAAHERLAALYFKANQPLKALTEWDALARMATAAVERIRWHLEIAQYHVTGGDSIAAYEQWLKIQSTFAALDQEQRRAVARDKRYERVLHHLESRIRMDVRETVLVALKERAKNEPDRAGWYLQQLAQLQRCMLVYDRAEDTFRDAMRQQHTYPGAYLDAAMLQYRLLRFKMAKQILSNLWQHVPLTNLPAEVTLDWRYRVLELFYNSGVPPALPSLLEWADAHAAAFADPAHLCNFRGNVFALYGAFDAATNAFATGVQTNAAFMDNYLDCGYLVCMRADVEGAARVLDQISAVRLPPAERRMLEADWRYIELHHTSMRPYALPE